MSKTFTLLVASTALAATIGFPAWSAMNVPVDGSPRALAALSEDIAGALPLVLASGDDDDDDRGDRETSRRGRDDDDDDDDDCDDDDDDECRSDARNAAPNGSVAPPRNGLFGNGAPPQVRVN